MEDSAEILVDSFFTPHIIELLKLWLTPNPEAITSVEKVMNADGLAIQIDHPIGTKEGWLAYEKFKQELIIFSKRVVADYNEAFVELVWVAFERKFDAITAEIIASRD